MIHGMQCKCTSCRAVDRRNTERLLKAVYILGGLALIAMLLFG